MTISIIKKTETSLTVNCWQLIIMLIHISKIRKELQCFL